AARVDRAGVSPLRRRGAGQWRRRDRRDRAREGPQAFPQPLPAGLGPGGGQLADGVLAEHAVAPAGKRLSARRIRRRVLVAMLDDAALDLLFREAHTANAFTAQPVRDEELRAIFELMRMAPTSANCQPGRF